jgi:hypothetical protein
VRAKGKEMMSAERVIDGLIVATLMLPFLLKTQD